MIALLIALQAAASPASGQPIVIGQDNVELNGAGKFTFAPVAADLLAVSPRTDDTIRFVDRLWFDETGKILSCEPRQAGWPALAKISCAQLQTSASFARYPFFTLPYRRGFIDVQFSVVVAPGGGRDAFAFPEPAYRNKLLDYPDDGTPPDRTLSPEYGKFAIALTGDEYPPGAIRYELESASAMLLGIDHTGAVKTCRPTGIGTRRSAMLDNYSCRLFVERGRFEHAAGAPPYEGLKYLRRNIRWKLPD